MAEPSRVAADLVVDRLRAWQVPCSYPAPGQAVAVQIDIDGRRLGARYPVDVPLIGNATEALAAATARAAARRPA